MLNECTPALLHVRENEGRGWGEVGIWSTPLWTDYSLLLYSTHLSLMFFATGAGQM